MASVPLGQAAAVLRAELAQRRLDPDRMSLFEAWAAFKVFARTPVVADDEECIVEFRALDPEDGLTHVMLSRRLAVLESPDADPDEEESVQLVREVVVDIGYAIALPSFKGDPTFCDVDYRDFATFVAAVEGSAPFQDAAARAADGSLVYENEG